MKQIGVAIIGTGWCGGIRAETCAASPLVKSLHLAEIRVRNGWPKSPRRPAPAPPPPTIASCSKIGEIEAVYISATPETTHYPMARDCLAAGKHVFLEKPIALELAEADELIALGAQERPQVHDRLLAALQPQVRLCEEIHSRGHDRPAGERAGEPAHHAQPGQEDQRARQALARGDGIDARPRFRAVVPGAGEAGARVLADQLRRDAGNDAARRSPTPSGSP